MKFAEKLRLLMDELGISQAELARLTGLSKASISQYLSGRNEPERPSRQKLAAALGVQTDYFDTFAPIPKVQKSEAVNLPVTLAAKLMGKSCRWVTQGLRDGVFPWGYAVKLNGWSYFISSVKFAEYTGIPVPYNQTTIGKEERV